MDLRWIERSPWLYRVDVENANKAWTLIFKSETNECWEWVCILQEMGLAQNLRLEGESILFPGRTF
jgi:hypothetical protein